MDRTDRVDRLQERLHTLKASMADATAALDPRDLEELSAALEKLQLTEIEIRHQNAQLAAARDALESERSRYRDLFKLAPDAYLITNRDGLICEANLAASRLLNVERKFLIGKPLQVFIPASDCSSFRAKVVQAQAASTAIEWRLRILPRDSPLVDVAAAVVPVTDRVSEPAGLRWSLRDISSQVRDEARIHDLNAELERRVTDRTAALEAANRAKDELLVRERAARDAAEEANRSKDEFLATISHELRTPLNVVLGWTYRMREHTLDNEQTERAIEAIDRNARQQLHLVEELLDSARMATGRFELHLKTQELGPLFQSAVESLEATAAARNIALTSAFAGGIYARVDPRRIRQVVSNLLNNALKFTGEHGTVRVSLRAETDHAVLTISDSGIGIAAGALGHVFEPFWQAEQSIRRARSGLGLGLPIVKHLVELHGGAVAAASGGSGQGATFTVRLPLAAPASFDSMPA
jgi:PAS domain S-box-containing protein